MKIGFGYDIHRLKRGKELIFGGVSIDYEKGIQGHYDADVVKHAIIDDEESLQLSENGDTSVLKIGKKHFTFIEYESKDIIKWFEKNYL